MSDALFFAIAAAFVAAGALLGSWRWAVAAVCLWLAAVTIIALSGGFESTGDDNSLGVFVFTAVPELLWVCAAALGVALRRAASSD